MDAADARAWHHVLVEGHEPLRRAQRLFRRLPSDPRCKLCCNPFGGPAGRLLRLTGFRPSRKNPALCTACCDRLPVGGIEIDVAVLFADVRGSVALAETQDASAHARRMQRFYTSATAVLLRHGALIDKFAGDQVVALFVPGIAGPDYRAQAARAAPEVVRAVAREAQLPLGAAVAAGPAFVGNVGGDHVVDLTALGDTVNVAARLQALAGAGEVVLQQDLHRFVAHLAPGGCAASLELRGRRMPVLTHTVVA